MSPVTTENKDSHAATGNELSNRIAAQAADSAENGDIVEAEPGTKERVIYALKCLIELVENDQIRASDIANMSTQEILILAEQKAAEARAIGAELKTVEG